MKKQRCYQIPKPALNLFLTALWVNFSETKQASEAKWIFDAGAYYDVVVELPFDREDIEASIARFAHDISVQAKGDG